MASQLMSLKDDVIRAHQQVCSSAQDTIEHALRCGELLTLLKPIVKENPATPSFGDWVEQYLPFSHRTANRYMKLHNDLGQLKNRQRLAIIQKAPSVDGVIKMLPDFKKPKPAEAPDVPFDCDEDFEAEDSLQAPGSPVKPPQEAEPPDPDKQIKNNRKVAKDLIDRAARAVCDYHVVKPNLRQRNRIVKALQRCGTEIW